MSIRVHAPSRRARVPLTFMAIAALALHAATAASAQELFRTHDGRVVDQLGHVANLGDVDADGVGDYIVIGRDSVGGSGMRVLYSGRTGSIIWGPIRDTFGTPPFIQILHGVGCVGDFDGDGLDDYGMAIDDLGSLPGIVRIISSATGLEILRVLRPNVPGFGSLVRDAGDVNGDGSDDFLVTAVVDVVSVYAGPTGTFLYDVTGPSFFQSATGIGDVNGDGFDDFAVGWQESDRVRVYSGIDGTMIVELLGDGAAGTGTFSQLGRDLRGPGDLNGDGVPDLVVGGPNGGCSPCIGGRPGFVRAYAGGTWEVLWETRGPIGNPWATIPRFSRLGAAIEIGGDLNGDGVTDLVCTCFGAGGFHLVEVLSGATGVTLYRVREFEIPGVVPGGTLMGRGGVLDDLDGDGFPEFAVVDGGEAPNGFNSGRVYIFKGSPGDALGFCPPPPNSTGAAARLKTHGPITARARETNLRIQQGVPGATAQVFWGLAGAGLPAGSGVFCLQPATAARYRAPVALDSAGQALIHVSWADPSLRGAWIAGSTWSVQAAYTDAQDPGRWNTTNALEITFTR